MSAVSSASTVQADFLFSVSLLWVFCIFVGFPCVHTFCVACGCLSERCAFLLVCACMCLTCVVSLV